MKVTNGKEKTKDIILLECLLLFSGIVPGILICKMSFLKYTRYMTTSLYFRDKILSYILCTKWINKGVEKCHLKL